MALKIWREVVRIPQSASTGSGRSLGTRMGKMAGYREAFIAAQVVSAQEVVTKMETRDHQGDQPERNMRNETLDEVCAGQHLRAQTLLFAPTR